MRKTGVRVRDLSPLYISYPVGQCHQVCWSQFLLSPSLGVDYWSEVKPSSWRLRSDIGWLRWGGVDRKGGPERRAQGAVPSSHWRI